MLKKILENMTIFIEPNTLLLGNQASGNRFAPIFPEYAMDWVIKELDEVEKRDGDIFYITEETKEQLRELAPYWEHNTTKDCGLAAMPASSKLFYDLGIIKAEGNITSGDAHLAVSYEKIMKYGLKHFEEKTKTAMAKLDLAKMANLKKFYFHQAVLVVIDAVKIFAKRYEELARKEAEKADDQRKTELLAIADMLIRVPYEPAMTMHEAVQSMWLVHLVLQIESNGHKVTKGVGHFLDMTTFGQVESAWNQIICDFTRHSVIIETCCDMVLEETVPDVLCSALVDDCINRGKTLKEGGAVYDFISGLQVGIANMADSLAAIKKCIFEDMSITKEELWDALQNDFEGEEGRRIQNLLLAAPKYGNDDDYVDSLIRSAYDVYIDEIKKYHNTRYGRGPIGGVYYAGTSSISANVGQGMGTLATPDGRKAHTPLV